MQDLSCPSILTAAAVTLARALPGAAVAYGEDNAIRDCEKRLRDEYKLSDFRHESAEKIPGKGHKFKVKGETKMDGKKYPFECAIADCHVTSITFNGPEPEGLGTSEKLAIGAAAAIPAGVIASKLSESDESSESRGMPAVDTAAAKTLLSPDESLQTLDFQPRVPRPLAAPSRATRPPPTSCR